MRAHRIKAVIRRHLYEARRNFDRISEIFYWPVIDIIIWGFLTIYLAREENLGLTFVSFLLGATILWGTFFVFQRDLALGFLAASLFSLLFYSFNIFPYIIQFLPFFFNLIFFAFSIGLIITALIVRYTTKIQMLAWSFSGLLQPVSCVFYPLRTLPKFLQAIAWYLPTTHAFEGMRQIISGGGFSSQNFWWGIYLNIIYLILAVLFFGYIFKIAKDKGLLVKLD